MLLGGICGNGLLGLLLGLESVIRIEFSRESFDIWEIYMILNSHFRDDSERYL